MIRNASGTLQRGPKQHIEWVSAPLVDAGQTVGHVLTLCDVSPRMELEQLRDDMMKMLIHDLRSPLSGILLGFDLLEFAFEDGDATEHADTIARMRQAAGHVLEHINTLLDINKLEAGKLTLDLAPCVIRDVFDVAATRPSATTTASALICRRACRLYRLMCGCCSVCLKTCWAMPSNLRQGMVRLQLVLSKTPLMAG